MYYLMPNKARRLHDKLHQRVKLFLFFVDNFRSKKMSLVTQTFHQSQKKQLVSSRKQKARPCRLLLGAKEEKKIIDVEMCTNKAMPKIALIVQSQPLTRRIKNRFPFRLRSMASIGFEYDLLITIDKFSFQKTITTFYVVLWIEISRVLVFKESLKHLLRSTSANLCQKYFTKSCFQFISFPDFCFYSCTHEKLCGNAQTTSSRRVYTLVIFIPLWFLH